MSWELEYNPVEYTPGKVFVEIGFGWDPAFLGASDDEVRRKQFENTHYIGVDINEMEIALSKDAASRHSTDHMLSIGLNHGTIWELELPEGSIDELYMANVLAETCVLQDYWDLTFGTMKLKEAYQAETDVMIKKVILRALYPRCDTGVYEPFSAVLAQLEYAKTLLKPGGKLTIVENNTPADMEIVKLLLDDMGFDVDSVITEEDEVEWRMLERSYHTQEGEILDQVAYAITAHVRSEITHDD